MKLDQLFQLNMTFRKLRLLAGSLETAGEFRRCTPFHSAACSHSPDELLIFTGLLLPRDEALLCELLQSPAVQSAAGLLVLALEDYNPAPLSGFSFPVLALPHSTDTNEVFTLIQAMLQGPDCYSNLLCGEFSRRAAPIVGAGRCTTELLSLLYTFLQVPAFLFSERYALPWNCFESKYAPTAKQLWNQRPAGAGDAFRAVHEDLQYLFYPISNSQATIAVLCVVYPAGLQPSRADLQLLQAALPQFSFLLLRNSLRRPFFYKQTAPFLQAALAGKFGDNEDLLRQNASHLDVEFAQARLLLLIEPEDPNAFHDQTNVSRINGYIASLRLKFHMLPLDRRLVYLIDSSVPQKVMAEFRQVVLPQLRRMADNSSMPSLTVGCSGGFSTLAGLPQALAEAEFALLMGRKASPGQTLYHYDDYMLHYLLSSIKETPAISLIYSEVITVLADYDRQNNTELLDTLLNLCQSNFSTNQAADQMYLHRNSLYKRISRISEILDMDLELPDNLVILHLAAKLYELLN